MEAIFDSIIGNIIVILAIVGGIAGFIKDRKSKEADHNKPYTTPKPTSTPSGGGYEVASEGRSYKMSDDNQQDYQMEEVHRAVKNGEHDAIVQNAHRKSSSVSNKPIQMKRQVKNSLSKQGLVSGIIMNEVLGQPRAIKPYKSVTAERKK